MYGDTSQCAQRGVARSIGSTANRDSHGRRTHHDGHVISCGHCQLLLPLTVHTPGPDTLDGAHNGVVEAANQPL
jgi:hypothetical protein